MKRLKFSAMVKRCLIACLFVATSFSFAQTISNHGFSTKSSASAASHSLSIDSAVIPWTEDWSSLNFANGWTFFPAQGPWAIKPSVGNPAPCIGFGPNSSFTEYSYSLLSIQLLANLYTCHEIYLDFDIKLDDKNQTAAESLLVEAYWGGLWHTVAEFKNEGSFEWTHHQITLNEVAGVSTRLRFVAQGSNCNDIIAWYIDNITVSPSPLPASDFSAHLVGFTPENNGLAKLNWKEPICPTINPSTTLTYIYDDSTYEHALSINPLTNAWLGNKFSTLDYGQIEWFEVFFTANLGGQDTWMTLDVFDDLGNQIGTSDPFLATPNTWIQVPASVPIPFLDAFYAMVHWDSVSMPTHHLAIDENGPNASQSIGYYKSVNTFQPIEVVFGGNPGVFLLRATIQTGKDKKMRTIGPEIDTPISILGYNVYRNDIKINNVPLADTFYVDTLSVYGVYDYYVKSVHQGAFGDIESIPSDVSEIVYLPYAVEKLETSRNLLYPNPATGLVTVKSAKQIKSIMVFDAIGNRRIYKEGIGCDEVKFHLHKCTSGIYYVEVTDVDDRKEVLRLAFLTD